MFYQHGHSTKIRHAFKECFSQTVDVYRMELFLFILLLSRWSAHVAFIIGVSIFSWVLHSVHHLRFYLLRQLTYYRQVGKKFPQKRSNNENEYIEQNIEKFKDFFFYKNCETQKATWSRYRELIFFFLEISFSAAPSSWSYLLHKFSQ